jgi:hypothetical protein
MNARQILTALAGIVFLFAGWVAPASAQQFRLGIQYTETTFHRARGIGVDRVLSGELGDRLHLKRWDFLSQRSASSFSMSLNAPLFTLAISERLIKYLPVSSVSRCIRPSSRATRSAASGKTTETPSLS